MKKGHDKHAADIHRSFGPGSYSYQAFACYDILDGGKQTLSEYGVWTGMTSYVQYLPCTPPLPTEIPLTRSEDFDAKGLGVTSLNLTRNLIGGVYESGALFSYEGDPTEINIRVGISFVSTDQACANAEGEVGDTSFEDIVAQSKALWNEKLSKVEIDLKNTPANVTEMLYSSLYRASLTPVSSLNPSDREAAADYYSEQRDWRDARRVRRYHSPVL